MSIFPEMHTPTHSLVIADLRHDSMDGQIAACGLQGIINRDSTEKVYVHHTYCADNCGGWNDPEEMGLHMAHTALQWLDHIYADIPKETLEPADSAEYPMLLSLMKRYGYLLKGAVIYDPDLEQATIELATTIAGQKDYLITSPALYEQLLAQGYVFPETKDLRACSFRSNVECLNYALEHYFENANHKVAFTWSHMTRGPESWGGANKDYVVANRLFTYYLNIFDQEERAHYQDVLERYPKGTPILGWTDEIVADGLFASLGMMMIPFISVENMTVASSFPPAELPPYRPECPELEEDAVYIVFQVADGDNLEHSLVYEPYTIARDPAFGAIPAAWVINPALCELAPRHLLYLTKVLREAGQEPTAMLSDGSPHPDRYTGFHQYCQILRYCMEKSGIVSMKQMADAEAVSWNVTPDVILSGYSGSDPRGIGPYEYHMDGKTFHMGSRPLGECDLTEIIRNAGRPFFLSVFAGTAAGSVASRIQSAADELRTAMPDTKFRFVVPSVAAMLYKRSCGKDC